MDLLLWRHAEAQPGEPDAARRLTANGERQAQRVAAWLEPRLPRRCMILVSPAERAQQTARALERAFRVVGALGAGASATSMLAAADWPHAPQPVLVVAHQPTLGEVASLLLAGTESQWSIPPGALWWLASRAQQGAATAMLRAAIAPDLV